MSRPISAGKWLARLSMATRNAKTVPSSTYLAETPSTVTRASPIAARPTTMPTVAIALPSNATDILAPLRGKPPVARQIPHRRWARNVVGSGG
jgi:hypothetical protein